MIKLPHDPRAFFLEQFDDDALQRLCRGVISGYKDASKLVQNQFGAAPEVGATALPHLRRALIDLNLLGIANRSAGLKAITAKNDVGNFDYVQVRTAHVALTACAVESPDAMVPYSIFRHQLAENPQQQLFASDDTQRNDIVTADALYAVLIHRSQENRPDLPGFLIVQFPDRSLKRYLGSRVDLLVRFPEIRALVSPVPEEQIAKPQPIQRRAKKSQENA